MNLGHDLANWFRGAFGSTQCRALTGCDFASAPDVRAYIVVDGTGSCMRIAKRVAGRVTRMLDRGGT
jgi:hypothetical protein